LGEGPARFLNRLYKVKAKNVYERSLLQSMEFENPPLYRELPQGKLEYLMPPYIPRGVITVISGKKSSNKSTWGAFSAARHSRGVNPFNGKFLPNAGMTLYYSLEDSTENVTYGRFLHFGGDDSKIRKGLARTINERDRIKHDFEFAKPDLVVIDSFSAFFQSSLGEKRLNEALEFLTELAAKHNCALVIIHHPKRGVKTADDCLAGAERLGNFIRAGYYLGRSKSHKDDRRFLSTFKFQYGKEPATIEFRLNHEFKIDKVTERKHLRCQDVINFQQADKNHCAVVALAVGARIEYQKADWLYREAGRERWDGTPGPISQRVLRPFGTYVQVPRTKPYMTLLKFIRNNPSGNYIVTTRKHQLAVNDGMRSDSTGLKSRVYEYWKLFK
jgi:hypothetical protein